MNKTIHFLSKFYHSTASTRLTRITPKSPFQNSRCGLHERFYSSSNNNVKVTIVGAAGKVGQSLCLMLKQSPLIDQLSIHDVEPTAGIAAELNQIDTKCVVSASCGGKCIKDALKGSQIVVVLASAPGASVLPLKDMWEPNAPIIREIVSDFGRQCPKALLAIGTNPIVSLIPMACEILKKQGCYNPNTIFGITTVDTVRANTFVAETQGVEPECVMVPVVGGNTEETMIPLLSKARPRCEFTNDELESITNGIKKAHENILKMKSGGAPLSIAFATARFIISLVKAVRGHPDQIETAFVPSCCHPQLKYLATPLLLGPGGVLKNLGLPEMTDYETCMFNNSITLLNQEIKKGESFVGVVDPKPCDPCDPNPNAPRCPPDFCERKLCDSVQPPKSKPQCP